ncbi:MAG: hypothetical protein E2O68_06900 [Deltaproteobacteria bacterium]|nr:MAG: hypothetical protein E2O68_06900 [Deltaproteobacteria bacterium]
MFKKIFLIIPLLFFIPKAYSQQSFSRVHLIKASQNPAENMKILNIFTNSAMYSYWVNKVLNGSGTRALFNPTIPETTPYQFFRILALFDLYFNHSILGLENSASGKMHYIYYSTLMTSSEIRSFPGFSLGGNSTVTSLAYGLIPMLGRQQFKSFTNRDILYFEDGPLFSERFRKKAQDRLKEKMAYIWDKVFSLVDSQDRMREVISGIVLPLTVLSDLHIDKSGKSYYNASFYLPGLVTIDRKRPNGKLSNDPLQWKIKPGLEQKLDKPIKGMAQVIEKISYLQDIQEKDRKEAIKDKVIKITFSKNFRNPDGLEMSMEFGQIPTKAHLSEMMEKEDNIEKKLRVYPLDLTKRDGALKMEGYINIAKGNLINKYLNKFHLQAWIHKLTFDMVTPKEYKTWKERFEKNPTIRLNHDIKKTIISVRLTKGANSSFHKGVLGKMGFTCKKGNKFMEEENIPVLKNYKYTCVADFSNSKEFNSKFFSKLGRPLVRKLIGASTHAEIKHTLKDLDKMPAPDLKMENALAQEILKILKNNQVIIEMLNLLPGGLSTALEGI